MFEPILEQTEQTNEVDSTNQIERVEPVAEPEFAAEAEEDPSLSDTASLRVLSSDEIDAAAADATAEVAAPAEVYSSMSVSGLSKRGMRLRLILVVVVVVACLGALYAFGVKRFGNRFLPNTSIYGCDVSSMTEKEATAALEAETLTYVCDISSNDFSASITGSDITLDRDEGAIAKEARTYQSKYAWPLRILFHDTLQPKMDVSFEEEALTGLLSQAVDAYNNDVLPTDNVTVSFDEEQGVYKVEGTTKGEALDGDVVRKTVLEDVRAMHSTSLPDAEKAFHKATIEDIPRYYGTVENVNRVRSSNISLLVNGEEVLVVDAGLLASWVSVGDGPSVVVDEDALRLYAESTVEGVAFHSDDWNNYYLDDDKFVSEFSARLAAGIVDGYELPTIDERSREGLSRDKAYERTPWNSELGRYIDVDLEAQFARFFHEDGEVVWESAFVSGNMLQGHSTVVGTFNIYSKQRGVVLVGLDYNHDGLPDYQSYVNYWMPFCGGYGLHDAPWRYAFGGDLYQYDGSHGCVNLPYEKAAELYDLVEVGEVVNVHW